jgi:uncharacterized protein (TIGR01655 family)
MTRTKKMLVVVGALIVMGAVALLSVHNEWTDQINPFINEETSYARVPLKTQTYQDVKIYSKTGQKLSYTLKHVKGYDATQQYAAIQHKGQYVKHLSYVANVPFVE